MVVKVSAGHTHVLVDTGNEQLPQSMQRASSSFSLILHLDLCSELVLATPRSVLEQERDGFAQRQWERRAAHRSSHRQSPSVLQHQEQGGRNPHPSAPTLHRHHPTTAREQQGNCKAEFTKILNMLHFLPSRKSLQPLFIEKNNLHILGEKNPKPFNKGAKFALH